MGARSRGEEDREASRDSRPPRRASSLGPDIELQKAALAAAMGSADAEERRQGISHATELPVADAAPWLLRALADVDWRVRKEGTFVANQFVDQAALVGALLPALRTSDDVGLRNAVVDVLAAASHAATAAVGGILAELDADGRKLAVDVLGRSGDPEALVPLQRALRDVDINVRQAAIEGIAALGSIARDSVREILLRELDDPDSFIRMAALDGLNELGVSIPWARLEHLLVDPTLRPSILRAAARSDGAGAAHALAKALESGRGTAFSHALASLAELAEGPHASRVAEALEAAGDAAFARVVGIAGGDEAASTIKRAMALIVAAVARAPGAALAAIRALAEPDLFEAGRRALTLLGPVALEPLLAALAARPGAPDSASLYDDPELRAALIEAARGLAISHPEATAPKLGALLVALRVEARHRHREVAAAALAALARLGNEDDITITGNVVSSAAPPIAHAAERALASLALRHPAAARTSATLAAAADPLSLRAVITLGALASTGEPTLGSHAADVAFLGHAATSGDASTRRAAVAAVAEIGGESAFDVLGLALTDEEPGVQIAAARALGRLSVSPRQAQPSAMSFPPRATDVLDLVGRSHQPELVAAAVRAMGEAAAGGSSRPPRPDETAAGAEATEEMRAALSRLTHDAPSVVSLAAIDAIGRAPLENPGRAIALVEALQHADENVVKSAMLKLGRSAPEIAEIARCLDHPSPEVRLLAAEVLGSAEEHDSRHHLADRAAIEPDRDVRAAIEAALAALRRDGGFSGP